MDTEYFKYFKYEIALNQPVPMPKPKMDWYPHSQFSVQQFLFMVCKENIGALGKKDGKWVPGEEEYKDIKLGSRQDVTDIFDATEKLGIIVPKPDAQQGEGVFVPYQLSETYWDKFNEHAS